MQCFTFIAAVGRLLLPVRPTATATSASSKLLSLIRDLTEYWVGFKSHSTPSSSFRRSPFTTFGLKKASGYASETNTGRSWLIRAVTSNRSRLE